MSDPNTQDRPHVPEGAVGISNGEFVVPGETPLFTADEPADDLPSAEADLSELDPELDTDVEDPAADNLADQDEENMYGNY
jgi:hypothetical protein